MQVVRTCWCIYSWSKIYIMLFYNRSLALFYISMLSSYEESGLKRVKPIKTFYKRLYVWRKDLIKCRRSFPKTQIAKQKYHAQIILALITYSCPIVPLHYGRISWYISIFAGEGKSAVQSNSPRARKWYRWLDMINLNSSGRFEALSYSAFIRVVLTLLMR